MPNLFILVLQVAVVLTACRLTGALFILVIISPAAVVFAVVWTTPYSITPTNPEDQAPTGPIRVLPAPDVLTGSLPETGTPSMAGR